MHALVRALTEKDCEMVGSVDEPTYGKFAWVSDPEDHKVERQEPPTGR